MDHHRAELEELQEKDPDFYEFLKEQDADLLDFNESDYEMDEAEDGDGGKEEDDTEGEDEEGEEAEEEKTNPLMALLTSMAEATQPAELITLIDSVDALTGKFIRISKMRRLLIKFLVKVWSRKSIDERQSAFNILKKLSKYGSKNFTTIYKKCYIAYVSVSRNVSSNSWKKLLFMQRTYAELTYLNPDVSYQLAFSYIRQFAIHLRNAKIAKRKDLIKTVYNWQYVLGLYLWASVLVYGNEHKDEFTGVDWINELIYNVIQITMGLIGVFTAPRFVPLRLHCVRILLQIQVHCDMFIPTLSLAADCLNDLIQIDKTKPSQGKSTQKATQIRNFIQLKNEMLKDVNYRRKVAKEIAEVLADAAQVIKEDPAFFEVYIPVKVTLKSFLRNCKNVEHKKMFKAFEQSIQGQDQDVES
ncbi:Nucleolar complex protein 2-like protein [Aphelenchoides bicaudatus]|nr:Nucleolar complex protein 2-like protein [Aphelenchoides bicaudatus]